LFINFKSIHPQRFYGSLLVIVLIAFTFLFKAYISEKLLSKVVPVSAYDTGESFNNLERVSIESLLATNNNANVQGSYTQTQVNKIRSDVGFADLRVLTLEDFFNHYGSPLADYSDDFIEACERYEVENWQLLAAIAIAETAGCQTGISYEQRNCWGWGGAGENRWEFDSFDEAIDTITYLMIRGYTNEYMNARDIQNTYCGRNCAQWGWRWARGVNYYVFRINDFGEKYGLERTHEIYSFDEQ